MEFEKNKLQWLEFDQLAEHLNISAGTFLRHGGTSTGAYANFNLSDAVGDHPDCVRKNKELLIQQLNIKNIVFAKQIHGNKIQQITSANHKFEDADGILTKEKNIALAITHADCQAALFYDVQNQIIGAAHAGWQGLVKNIYKEMISAFKTLGSKPENILVCISPSLGPDHAEFKNYKNEFPKEFWVFQAKPFYFNLWEIARSQLTAAGIRPQNIEIVELCTFCNFKDYYSFRREKVTGRNCTTIALRP